MAPKSAPNAPSMARRTPEGSGDPDPALVVMAASVAAVTSPPAAPTSTLVSEWASTRRFTTSFPALACSSAKGPAWPWLVAMVGVAAPWGSLSFSGWLRARRMATTFPANRSRGTSAWVKRPARFLERHARADVGRREPRRGKPMGKPWCRSSTGSGQLHRSEEFPLLLARAHLPAELGHDGRLLAGRGALHGLPDIDGHAEL